MISEDALFTIRNKYQTVDLNVRREYLQHLFLSYFYGHPLANRIFFKGGTALRIIYKSPRFSEDLDFGSTLHDIIEIEKAILDTLIAIQREGIETEIIESKKTTGGYLAYIDFMLGPEAVRLRIEASFREKELLGEAEQIFNDFIPPYNINVIVKEKLVAGKLSALLDRHKPRDFYDLYFLLQKDMVTPKQKNLLREAKRLVSNTTINFNNELKQFLPQSHIPVIKDFKVVLERTISKFI